MKQSEKSIIKTVLWVSAFVFILGFVLTAIVLTSRLADFTHKDSADTVIELNIKNASDIDESSELPEDTEVPNVQPTPAAPTENVNGNTEFKPGFEVTDNEGVWEQNQQVEIFKIKYDETGEVTVDGIDDKLIAPGTSNLYNFTLKNTGNVPLDYILTTEVEFSNQEYSLPVSVRLNDSNGKYIIGSADAFDDAVKLNAVGEKAGISPKSFVNYSLEWKWPFESETDAYDTLLGNMAVNEDLVMTVKINVRAEANIDSEGGGNPYTGDSGTGIYVTLAVISLAMVLMLIILDKKQLEERKENE